MKIYAYSEKTIKALVKKSENKLKKNPKYNEIMNSRLQYFQVDMLKENAQKQQKQTEK